MSHQQTIAALRCSIRHTLPARPDCVERLLTQPASFAVHRNNVIVSLVDALADTFAVTQELVGELSSARWRVNCLRQPPTFAVNGLLRRRVFHDLSNAFRPPPSPHWRRRPAEIPARARHHAAEDRDGGSHRRRL